MDEIISLAAVLAAVSGAIFSVIKGWWNSPDPEQFKKGRLISSLIISAMAAISVVNFSVISQQLDTIGIVGMISSMILVGFGLDQGLSDLDK